MSAGLRISILSFLLLTLSFGSEGHAETPRVAVLDFTVAEAAGGSAQWVWARGGLADLLQIQLQQQGLVLLDRDLIHSVLNEQRLAASGVIADKQVSLARLLNAQYLVTGHVIPCDGERFRVEASVFSVEAIEAVVAATSEGRFPSDISSVLETVAGKITASLKARAGFNPTPQRAEPAPKPEALIMFYRGLDAAAQEQPARAAAYFMNAAALDNQFTVPLLWEIKAYEMAGLTNHAAVRRQEIAAVLTPLGIAPAPSAASPRPAKRVIAVLAPVVTGGEAAITAASLSGELTRVLLEQDQVRVFAPEGIDAAVAEQDLKLSALFDRQFAPRYGRWLASDGLLLCRVNPADTNRVVIELSLANPLTAAVGPRVQRVGRTSELNKLLRSGTDELLRQWTTSPRRAEPLTVVAVPATNSIADRVTDLRPVYRDLATALVRVRRQSNESGAHSALADAFAATGRPRLAALEIERCLEQLDIHAPRADKTFLGTHRWLFWSAQPARIAVGFVDPRAIDRLIEQLLTTYPDSLAAGCLNYNLAVSDWMAKNWEAAANHAIAARPSIRPPEKNAEMDHELFAATFFLEGDALVGLGRTNAAREVFTKGLEYMSANNVRNFCLPYGPWIDDFFGTEKVYGYGGDPPGIRTRIEEALAKLNGNPAPTNHPPVTKESVVIASAPDSPAVTWIKRADAELQAGRYAAVLNAYQSALTTGAALAQCGGLRAALAELALERNRDHAVDEVERCRVEFGLPPEVVTWVEWFAAGQKYQTSRAFDFEKAAAAYRSAMEFLEDPERGGLFQLEPQRGSDRIALAWDRRANGFDLHWSELYGARWNNAAYQLAQCLIELGRAEEAAQWLRRIALHVGGDDLPLYKSVGWNYASYTTVKLGVLAADQLKVLHLSLGQPKFGAAPGPYQSPPGRPRAPAAGSPLPLVAPEVMQALTNTLTEFRRAADEVTRREALNRFAAQHKREVGAAALTLLPVTADPDSANDLLWLLGQNATSADAPGIVAACAIHWRLIPLANRLDPNATAAALFAEWRAHAAQNFIPPDLIYAIANARVRPMFAPVLEQISGKWINHHSVVFLMDSVVRQEKSDELTGAFRDAMGSCLRLKLEQNDHYELPRISRIALRHGVPEAIAATVVCDSASPEQLRKALAPFLELPAGDEAALAYLRTNGSRWQWESATGKFKSLPQEKL